MCTSFGAKIPGLDLGLPLPSSVMLNDFVSLRPGFVISSKASRSKNNGPGTEGHQGKKPWYLAIGKTGETKDLAPFFP